MSEQKGANCFKCQYRRSVPGSCHSSCAHPAFDEYKNNPLLEVLSLMRGVTAQSSECRVVGHPHGVRNGWFSHPFNFDPVWLVSCTGFTPKEDEPKEAEDK